MAVRTVKTESMNLPILYRSFQVPRDAEGRAMTLNKEKRTVRVQFSSEAPVKRWFGMEVLDHQRGSVDMKRVKAGTAVLYEHDTAQRVGITESGTITGDKVGEAEIRFSKTALGNDMLMEIEDGTLRWISVGYHVRSFEVNEETDEWRAIDWEPLEVSLTGIPADTSCKIYRSKQTKEEHSVMITRSIRLAPTAADPTGGAPAAPELDEDGNPIPADTDANKRASVELEIREVYALGHKWEKDYPGAIDEADRLVKEGERMLETMRGWVMTKWAEKAPTNVPNGGTGERAGKTRQNLSYGEMFCQTEQYKRFGKNSGQKRSIVCEMPDRLQFRATFNATTEALTSIQKVAGVPGILDQQTLMVADLFAQGSTGSNTIRYIQEDSYTQAATSVAEAGAKPEATLNVSEVDATVRKIAVWTKVTDEMLSDFEQISSYINARLAYMVQSLEDNHLLNGTGANNQIKGVLNFTGLQTVSGAANPLDGVLRAIAYVRGANGSGFGEPDGIVMHPKDWMNAKLTKDANLQYYGGGPFSGTYGAGMYSNVYNMWGLPCVVTTAIAQGTALVGAFRMAAQIFRKKGLTIESTNSNEDDFKNNLVMLRAEERLALAVYQPNKFCTVTAIPAV